MGNVLSFITNIGKVEDPNAELIQKLFDKGICWKCIQRYTMSDFDLIGKLVGKDMYQKNCYICQGLSNGIYEIVEKLHKELIIHEFHDIFAEVPRKIKNDDNNLAIRFCFSNSCMLKMWLRGKFNSKFRYSKDGPRLVVKLKPPNKYEFDIQWPTLYIVGRYLKESRRVSNSKFFAGYSVSSVEEELLDYFSQIVKASEMSFESLGREDCDVRMIGHGRKFCVTLKDPKPSFPVSNFSEFIDKVKSSLPSEVVLNNNVSLKQIELDTKAHDMEPKHSKNYRCIVAFNKCVTEDMLHRLDTIKNLQITQKTPSRVAHRRASLDREKMILSLKWKVISAKFIILDLETTKGTYIKEFVNSDFGRTKPSLSDLIGPDNELHCELLQLDVQSVNDDD